MQKYSAMKCLCAVTCIMIVVATVTSAAPSYADYDSKLIISIGVVTLQKPDGVRTTSIIMILLLDVYF